MTTSYVKIEVENQSTFENDSSQILSMCSPVFYSLFFGGFNETSKEEVEIKEVDYDVRVFLQIRFIFFQQFLDFLNVLHPTTFTEILS